jgi:hypothetical protein|tara:strand:- start:1152 stop:1472 length:321 start_codon:yes stop_codon:yes gene_type:complete
MAKKQYVISETGEFPAKYMVLRLDDDSIYRPIFGPDADLVDAERKCGEMNAKENFVADDPFTADVNEVHVDVKAPTKKKATKAPVKKKTAKKKTAKKTAAKKSTKK